MTFTKTHRWLLFSAGLIALSAIAGSSWLLSSGQPPSAGRDADFRPDDFREYAEELRTKGLPEPTVRELVASRITAAFEKRRAALCKSGTDVAGLTTQLDALNREQGALIAKFLGTDVRPVTEDTTRVVANVVPHLEDPVLMPAVMAEAPPSAVRTDEQAAEWEKLREDFAHAVSTENQDPGSRPYRQRWRQAEAEADRMFRLQFGDTAFVQHQLQAQNEAELRKPDQAKH